MEQPFLSEHDSSRPRKSELPSCRNEERRPSRTMFAKILLVGIASGLVLQVIKISAFVTILKAWGRDTQPQDLSNRAIYHILFLLSWADIAAYLLMITMWVFALTRSGSMHWRKKFDHENRTRNKEEERGSIWCSRQFLFRAGVTFLFGIRFGTIAVCVAVDYKIGGMPLLLETFVLLLDLVILPVMCRCFDWVEEREEEASTDEEQEEEEQACYAVV
jgi:hypothetical protein